MSGTRSVKFQLDRADGTALIHYTTIYKVFAKWADDGSLEQAFIASVRHLAEHRQLDRSQHPAWRWHQHGCQKGRRLHWLATSRKLAGYLLLS
jgi:hypothetical protein